MNRRDLFKAAAGVAAAGMLPAVGGPKYAIVSTGQFEVSIPRDYRIVSRKRTPVYDDAGRMLYHLHEYVLEEVPT
jgi:hypothetical protein